MKFSYLEQAQVQTILTLHSDPFLINGPVVYIFLGLVDIA